MGWKQCRVWGIPNVDRIQNNILILQPNIDSFGVKGTVCACLSTAFDASESVFMLTTDSAPNIHIHSLEFNLRHLTAPDPGYR